MGNTAIECSIVGLGTGRLASVANGVSRADAMRLIGVAQDCGINLIDTADSYAQGGSEKIIGRALEGKRDKFIIITKAGYRFSTVGSGLRLIKPLAKRVLKYFKGGKNVTGSVRSNVARQDFAPSNIRNCAEASLHRLRTDYIDFFLLHSPAPGVMADDSLFEMLRQLKQEGKIRHFGVSSPESEVLESALRISGLSMVQTPVSPAQNSNRNTLLKLDTAKIGIVANQIFLSGKLLSAGNEEDKSVAKLKAGLEAIAMAKGISLNRLLIEFALEQTGIVSILTGTTNPAHLRQNVADALAPRALSATNVPVLAP